jgi:hypothetical protein
MTARFCPLCHGPCPAWALGWALVCAWAGILGFIVAGVRLFQ